MFLFLVSRLKCAEKIRCCSGGDAGWRYRPATACESNLATSSVARWDGKRSGYFGRGADSGLLERRLAAPETGQASSLLGKPCGLNEFGRFWTLRLLDGCRAALVDSRGAVPTCDLRLRRDSQALRYTCSDKHAHDCLPHARTQDRRRALAQR